MTIKFSFISFTLLLSFGLFASTETVVAPKFSKVIKLINDYSKEEVPENVLIIFDLDETLVISEECDELNPNSRGIFRFEEKIKKCNARLTSSLVPAFLSKIQNAGHPAMGFTARGISVIKATIDQLENRVYDNNDKHVSIKFQTAPWYSIKSDSITFNQVTSRSESEKKVTILKGVAFASGANKGQALDAYLKSLDNEYSFNKIVFVDDQKKNITNLEKAFSETERDMLFIHYTEHVE